MSSEVKRNVITTNRASTVFIGHVDAGKSSLCGRLMVTCKAVDQRALDKLVKKADSNNMHTFYLAYMTDDNPDEQKRGITIVANTKQFVLPGSGKVVTLVDAPGHRDFINNMITGASQCNYAVLVVSAVSSEFRAGIQPTGQTLEHMLLINALGVSKLIVAINKMDADEVNYSEARFNEIKVEITRQYKKVGGKVANIAFVPISGYTDVNILTVNNDKTPWYKGKSLIELMDEWPPIEHDLDLPMRMSVTGLCKVSGAGQVVTGKIHSGVLRIGDKVESRPNEFTAFVKSIEKFHKNAKEAFPDDNIGMSLKGKSDDKVLSKKGDIIGAFGTGMSTVRRFQGVFAITASLKRDLSIGFKPVISSHTARVAAILADVISIKEKKTNKDVVEERKTLKTGDRVVAIFQPEKEFAIEYDKRFGYLTRFVVRNSNTTIGIGQCQKWCNESFDKDCALKIKQSSTGGKQKGKATKKQKNTGAAAAA